MARLFMAGTNVREILLQDAEREGLEWDVFVSHKSTDSANAIRIARRIQSSGLSVWVDRLDANMWGDEDGPWLDHYIETILSRSFSLLALVTDLTHESWWVPFEIGLAFELRRYLSSFAHGTIRLPSFLAKHPRLSSDGDIDPWCERLKQLKRRGRTERVSSIRGYAVMAEKRGAYLDEMGRLTRDFS